MLQQVGSLDVTYADGRRETHPLYSGIYPGFQTCAEGKPIGDDEHWVPAKMLINVEVFVKGLAWSCCYARMHGES